MLPTQITALAVSKSFNGRLVLDSVTCSLVAGERTGIVGENGSGKTTLLRLLAGRERPDQGEVVVQADGGVGYLAQDGRLPPDATVQQIIDPALSDLRAVEERMRRLEAAMAEGDESGMAEYGDLMTIFDLRGGYDADARVERALHGLGLEPVGRGRTVGSLSGGEQVRLRLAAVLAAAPEVLLLDEPTNHLDENTAARQRWAQAHDQWRADIDRLREAAATTARQVAPGRVMKDRNKMAYDRAGSRVQQSLASRVRYAKERLRRLLANPVPPPPEPLRFTAVLRARRLQGAVLEAADVSVTDRLGRTSLTVTAGERLLITGPNGAGKSTLLRVLTGGVAPDSGSVTRRGRIGYLPQDPRPGAPDETLLAAFARGLDEPTNHLSPALVEDLETALTGYDGALVIVSHDRRLRRRWQGAHLAMQATPTPAARA